MITLFVDGRHKNSLSSDLMRDTRRTARKKANKNKTFQPSFSLAFFCSCLQYWAATGGVLWQRKKKLCFLSLHSSLGHIKAKPKASLLDTVAHSNDEQKKHKPHRTSLSSLLKSRRPRPEYRSNSGLDLETGTAWQCLANRKPMGTTLQPIRK